MLGTTESPSSNFQAGYQARQRARDDRDNSGSDDRQRRPQDPNSDIQPGGVVVDEGSRSRPISSVRSRQSTVPATTPRASVTPAPLPRQTAPAVITEEAHVQTRLQPLEAAGTGYRSGDDQQCPIDLTAEDTLQDQAAKEPQVSRCTVAKAEKATETAKADRSLVMRIKKGYEDAEIAHRNAAAKRLIATGDQMEAGEPTDGTLKEGDEEDEEDKPPEL